LVQPIVIVNYNTALEKTHNNTDITAVKVMDGLGKNLITQRNDGQTTVDKLLSSKIGENNIYDNLAYDLTIKQALGLNASSDIVTLYLEPALGVKFTEDGYKSTKIDVGLAWSAYAEIYI